MSKITRVRPYLEFDVRQWAFGVFGDASRRKVFEVGLALGPICVGVEFFRD